MKDSKFLIFLFFVVLMQTSFTFSSKIKSNSNALAQTTYNNQISDADMEQARDFALSVGDAYGHIGNLKDLHNFAKQRSFKGATMSHKAAAAEQLLKLLIVLVDFFLSHGERTSWIYFKSDTHKAWTIFEWSHSYQMNHWDHQWQHMRNLNYHEQSGSNQIVYKVTTASKPTGWGDTNAEAQYKIWCQKDNRYVRFQFQVRNYEWLKVHWIGNDAYNSCYDLQISGMFKTTRKRSSSRLDSKYITEENYVREQLVTGTVGIPNQDGNFYVTLIDHVVGSRFPVLYEHCDYLGKSMPIGANGKTAYHNLGDQWNDKVSSVRVPPGMRLRLFEHANYRGSYRDYTGDNNCMHGFHDVASSLLLNIGENDK
jgi:hypothetical protein